MTQKNKKPESKHYITFTLVCMAASALFYRFTLSEPFHDDDFGFARLAHLNLWETLQLWAPSGWFYRPVFLLWFKGLLIVFSFNVLYFHVASILMHGCVVALLGLLAWRLTSHAWGGVAAAGLLLLTPAANEAVSWASSASTLLTAAFGLTAAHAWLTWRETSRPGWFVAALAALWFSMCSKEEGLTIPVLLLTLDLTRGVNWKHTIKPFVPVSLLVAVYLALEALSIQQFRAEPAPWIDFGTGTYSSANAAPLLVRLKMFLPVADIATQGVLNLFPWSLLSVITGAAICGVIGAKAKDRALLVSGVWLIPACLMFPALIGRDSTGSRFLYFPVIAGALFLAVLATALVTRGASGRVAAAMVAIGYIAPSVPFGNDPVFGMWSGFGVLCTTVLVWRGGLVEWRPAVSVALAVLGTQLPLMVGWGMPDWWPLALIVSCAALHGRAWAIGALLAIAALSAPSIAPWLVLAACSYLGRQKGGKPHLKSPALS